MTEAQRATFHKLSEWCTVTIAIADNERICFAADSKREDWSFGGFIAPNGNLENVGNITR